MSRVRSPSPAPICIFARHRSSQRGANHSTPYRMEPEGTLNGGTSTRSRHSWTSCQLARGRRQPYRLGPSHSKGGPYRGKDDRRQEGGRTHRLLPQRTRLASVQFFTRKARGSRVARYTIRPSCQDRSGGPLRVLGRRASSQSILEHHRTRRGQALQASNRLR